MKWIGLGILLGLLLALVGHFGVTGLLTAFVVLLLLAGFVDWSGQGDGRQGCNRHTNCDH